MHRFKHNPKVSVTSAESGLLWCPLVSSLGASHALTPPDAGRVSRHGSLLMPPAGWPCPGCDPLGIAHIQRLTKAGSDPAPGCPSCWVALPRLWSSGDSPYPATDQGGLRPSPGLSQLQGSSRIRAASLLNFFPCPGPPTLSQGAAPGNAPR